MCVKLQGNLYSISMRKLMILEGLFGVKCKRNIMLRPGHTNQFFKKAKTNCVSWRQTKIVSKDRLDKYS